MSSICSVSVERPRLLSSLSLSSLLNRQWVSLLFTAPSLHAQPPQVTLALFLALLWQFQYLIARRFARGCLPKRRDDHAPLPRNASACIRRMRHQFMIPHRHGSTAPRLPMYTFFALKARASSHDYHARQIHISYPSLRSPMQIVVLYRAWVHSR